MKVRQNRKPIFLIALSVLLMAVFVAAITLHIKRNTPETAAVTYLSQESANDVLSALQERDEELTLLDLSTLNPIYTESQSTSELCWDYASCKALETAIMVQEGEYVNFSEVGMALLYYEYMKAAGTPIELFSVGNFDHFNTIAQQYGLVYENDFSNSLYYSITEENLENFNYIKRETDRSTAKRFLPINIPNSQTYLNASSDEKTKIIKSFIKNYGGLFAGISQGYLYSEGGHNFYSAESSHGGISIGAHAVCIIGYSDELHSYLALNSWDNMEKFYIPYDAENVINTFRGYVLSQSQTQMTVSSNAAGFNSVLNGCKLKNVLTMDELHNFEISYHFNSANFSSIYAEISSNGADYSKKFLFNYNDALSTVTVSYSGTDSLEAGTYLIKFYSSNGLLAVKTLYFYSGAEISYAALYNSDENPYLMLDSYALVNTFAGGDSTATFYVSFRKKFNLKLFYTYLSRDVQATIENMYVYSDQSYSYNEYSFAEIDSNNNTVLSINIDTERIGVITGFTIKLSSNGAVKEFYIQIIVSSFEAQTRDAHEIFYMTDGGKNSKDNICKAPQYRRETEMTDFVLQEPAKDGYVFEGWFLEPNFSGERVEKIDSKIQSDVVLYAKWSPTTEVEFDGKLKLETEQIICYGDEFNVEYSFIESEDIVGKNYLLVYELFVDGTYRTGDTVNGSSGLVITFPFTYQGDRDSSKIGIGAGDIQVSLAAKVVANHRQTIEKDCELVLNVGQRETSANYIKQDLIYDANFHLPKVEFVDLLPNDSAEALLNISAQRNAGKYIFNIVGINNNNYKLSETDSFEFEIQKKPINVKWTNMVRTYNGTLQFPDVKFEGTLNGDTVYYEFEAISKDNATAINFVSAGNYTVNIKLEDGNYVASNEEVQIFSILKRELRIEIDDITQRLQVAPENRARPTYRLLDDIVYGDILGLEIKCDALNANKSGEYRIDASVKNSNYVLKYKGATYTLTGYYLVHYTLPDGSIYIERVEEGCAPKGVDSKVYKKPLFSRFVYSRQLSPSTDDIYVAVSTSSYLWVIVVVSAVLILGVLYFIFNRNVLKSKVR